MGMKIKKDVKPQIHKLPVLKIRYSFVVPFMGLVDTATMISFYRNPATDGNWFMKAFFLVFAAVGLGFAFWGFFWRTTVDGKTIKVRPVIGKNKEVLLTDLKKAVVHKKKKSGSLVYFHLIDKNNQEIVKIYPLMQEGSTLLERLKRLNYSIEEVIDQ